MTPEINENETLDELLARAQEEESVADEEVSNADTETDLQGESDSFDHEDSSDSTAQADSSDNDSFSLEDKTFYEDRLAEMAEQMEKMAGAVLYWQEMAHSSSVYAQEMGTDALLRMKEAAQAQLQTAKLSKKVAYEAEDLDAQVAADEDLMRATATLHWIGQQPPSTKKTKGTASQAESKRTNLNQIDSAHMVESEMELHPAVNQWIEKNPWMDEVDPRFDPEKAQAVVKYAGQLEKSLIRSGREFEINSPSYFKRLDNYIREFSQAKNAEFASKTNPPSSVLKPASGKKESVSQSLTEAEKEVCASLGISHKVYLKNREYDRRQQAFKQGNQIYGEIK